MQNTAQASRSRESLLRHALRYAEQGWPVLPVRARGKTPLTSHGVKDATTDAATIRNWWRRWPNANIGIALARDIVVVDVDSEEALQRLKHQDLGLPSTTTALTGRGRHSWYSTEGQAVKNGVGVLPGIDVRSEGGYVIVPPSVHRSGAIYHWKVPLHRDAISECPGWLLKRLEKHSRQGRGRLAKEWQELISKPVLEGRRNQVLTELAGLLLRRLPAEVATELAYCWAKVKLRPALPDDEVLRTIHSIASRERRRLPDRLPSPQEPKLGGPNAATKSEDP